MVVRVPVWVGVWLGVMPVELVWLGDPVKLAVTVCVFVCVIERVAEGV